MNSVDGLFLLFVVVLERRLLLISVQFSSGLGLGLISKATAVSGCCFFAASLVSVNGVWCKEVRPWGLFVPSADVSAGAVRRTARRVVCSEIQSRGGAS